MTLIIFSMEYRDDDRDYIRPPVRRSTTEYTGPPLTISEALKHALVAMYTNPTSLEQKPLEMMARLRTHYNSEGQGSANPVTPHEACIALVLEQHGFTLTPQRNTVPEQSGLYIWYQPDGTQRKGDFVVFESVRGTIGASITIDAKHSNSTIIYLNDGTFEAGVVYIISFTRILPRVKGQRKGERKNECVIGLGQNIMCEEDCARMIRWRDEIRRLNSLDMGTGDLCLYARSANKYECAKRFSEDFKKDRLNQTLAWLQPSGQ